MRTARARPNVALTWSPSMSLGRAPAPAQRRIGNRENSRWIGRRRRGRSFCPPVRGRDFAAAIPVLQHGPRDAVTDSVPERFRCLDVAGFQQAVDRFLRYPHEDRRLRCRDLVSYLHLASFCIWRTARAMSLEIGIPSSFFDSFFKKTKRSAGRLMLVFSYVACTAQSVAIGSNAWQCIF